MPRNRTAPRTVGNARCGDDLGHHRDEGVSAWYPGRGHPERDFRAVRDDPRSPGRWSGVRRRGPARLYPQTAYLAGTGHLDEPVSGGGQVSAGVETAPSSLDPALVEAAAAGPAVGPRPAGRRPRRAAA